jgi:hypothetical protein
MEENNKTRARKEKGSEWNGMGEWVSSALLKSARENEREDCRFKGLLQFHHLPDSAQRWENHPAVWVWF